MHMEKLQLEQNISSYIKNVCTLPDSASGNLACELIGPKIQSNTACIRETKNWFDDNLSPLETP
jgi:hypothetical protein